MYHFQGFTQAKDPDAPETNEDRIVAIPNRLYAVIDGATDISGLRYDDRLGQGATGGYLAAQAVAEVLATAAAGPLTRLPDPTALVIDLNTAIAATYQRLRIAGSDIRSGLARFRAAFSAAFAVGDMVRLVALGDCTIRVNGKVVLDHHFPGDTVLSKARAVAWTMLLEKGLSVADIRPIARQLIVQGPTSATPVPQPLTAVDLAAIVAAVRRDGPVLEACGNDLALVDKILAAGLEGIRANPETFHASALDGVSDTSSSVRVLDLPRSEINTLELATDGYPALPDATGIAAWEAALAEADRTDPDRVGPHASTKGRVGKNFGDDRSILFISAGIN
ncbi:hypothetical protein GGR20_003285 [Devosia subaequoris]|uniref:Uncharacterized protein n=1 Tax=Devosia subaequoris TaxID=395930 RepID=A0A7W6ND43_9HYPH|nr:hypothetical protein [Devosia subaequoris]MBB4053623.1 hypothetical protein [Devosia subaequoris]MCP1211242.1 hypothetical protein [Devosia subaequoris]